MELGYWGIKGVVEPIRWLIAHLGLEVKEYNPASAEEWFGTKKQSLGLDFPNLPYLIDGDVKISESIAIPYYLVHKAGKPELLGKDLKDQAKIREIEGVFLDIRKEIHQIVFAPENHKAALLKALEPNSAISTKLANLEKLLGNKEFFLGYLTYADLLFAYHSEFLWAVADSLGEKDPIATRHPALDKHCYKIHDLPKIKERVAQSMSVPFMPPPMLKFHLETLGEVFEKNNVGKAPAEAK